MPGEIGLMQELEWHVCFLWKRMLPYHAARLRAVRSHFSGRNIRITAIESSSSDNTYSMLGPVADAERITAFASNYSLNSPRDIYERISSLLNEVCPDVIFCPASPFPEGMAAIHYRNSRGGRVFVMDDMWEETDKRGAVNRSIKRAIYRSCDGIFVPHAGYSTYYQSLGFDQQRIFWPVDVVDMDGFRSAATESRHASNTRYESERKHFVFIGRLVERKGVATLLRAYLNYRSQVLDPWELHIYGDGTLRGSVEAACREREGIYFHGPVQGHEVAITLSRAAACIVPSDFDQWGLVVNEAVATLTPIIATTTTGAARFALQAGQSALIVPPKDAHHLAAAMYEMAKMSSEAKRRMTLEADAAFQEIGLKQFALAVDRSLSISRKLEAPVASRLLAQAWRGHRVRE